MTRAPYLLTRRAAVSGVLSGLGGVAFAAAPATALRPKPRPGGDAPKSAPVATPEAPSASERFVKAANLGGDVGFAVVDVASGELLEARLGAMPLPPASTLKVITALYNEI